MRRESTCGENTQIEQRGNMRRAEREREREREREPKLIVFSVRGSVTASEEVLHSSNLYFENKKYKVTKNKFL